MQAGCASSHLQPGNTCWWLEIRPGCEEEAAGAARAVFPGIPGRFRALAAGTEGAQLLLGVVSTQLCLQQLSRDEFHQQESCSYKFNFESDPSTSANVFRLPDLWGVNSVSASGQRAWAGREEMDSHGPGFTQGQFHSLSSTKCLLLWGKLSSLLLKNCFSLILEPVLIWSLENVNF